MNSPMRILGCSVLVSLCALACTHVPDPSHVQPFGPDTSERWQKEAEAVARARANGWELYTISHTPTLRMTNAWGMSNAMDNAYSDADAFCKARGGEMAIERSETIVVGTRFEIIFHCSSEPEAPSL